MSGIECPKCKKECDIDAMDFSDFRLNYDCEHCDFEFIVYIENEPSYFAVCKDHDYAKPEEDTVALFCHNCKHCKIVNG